MNRYWKKVKLMMLACMAVFVSGGIAELLVFGENQAYAANTTKWDSVGSAGFSAGEVWESSLFMYNGTPYVVYIEGNVNTVTVRRYNGSSWESVGSPISVSWATAKSPSLFVYNGTPYVAYGDGLNGGKVTVQKYNGVSWELVGGAGISANYAEFISLYIDNGIPYVAYKDYGNANKATVMKYNGSVWEPVGNAGFSAGEIYGMSLKVNNGTPYVTYSDGANSSKATVMKYNGSVWEAVGGAGFTPGRADYISLYIDNGTPYVSYMDFANSLKATVMKFNGDTWETVGNAGFSEGSVGYTSLDIDQGIPYVAFADSQRATVMKYNGNDWETIGDPRFSAGRAEYVSLQVYDGIPYIAYKDHASSAKVTVMKQRFTVTYQGNGSTGGAVPADSAGYDKNTNAAVLGNPGNLVRTGYTFAGWNTALDGSGMSYDAGDHINVGQSGATLYAKWVVNSYTVNYDGNGATAGAAPPSGSHTYNTGVTMPGNSGNLVRTGYTFAGWNTAANGSGTNYPAGSTYTIGAAHVTLYAKWTINSYTVSFNSNGGSTIGSQTVNYGGAAIRPNDPIKTGHTFEGWYKDSGLTIDFDFAEEIEDHTTLYANWTVNSYTVTYNDNGSEGGSVPAGGSYGYNTGVLIPGNPGGLVKTGYTLAGWNTAADGSGSGYMTVDTLTMGAANVTLYAQWTIDSYSVTFNGNGATSGSVPADSSHVYNTGVTVQGNPGGLVKTGHTFAGWNTAADGSGTDYTTGETFTIGAANVTLYAQWTINGYKVTYDGNGATSGNVPEDSSHNYNTSVTVPGNPGGLAKTVHTFAGWNTAADGSGTDYVESDSFTIGAADVTLYAQWTVNRYTVTYDGNGATSGRVPADSSHDYNTVVTVPGNPGDLVRTGHTFAGWTTAADGGGTDYVESDEFAIGAADVTLYAIWTVNHYTISFESNGGSPVDPQTIGYNRLAVEPTEPTKTGYTFGGWYTDGEDLTRAYDFAAPIGDADVTLYAKWLSAYVLLSGLTADQGTLDSEFSPSKTNYTIDAAKAVSSLNFFVTKEDPTQTLTVTGATYDSVTDSVYTYNASNLSVGPNLIQITVTAENQDQNTYTLTVNVSDEDVMGQPVPLDPSIRTIKFPGGLAIRLPDGLSIPQGATLTVRHSDAAPSGEVNLSAAGQIVDFQFEGITIDQPVEITLGFDDNVDPSKLAIFYYNESTGKWEYHPSEVTDNGIRTSVGHFSTYGVLADTTAPDQVTVASDEKTARSITLQLGAYDDTGVKKYLIYRDGTLVAETEESMYVDTGLSASRKYTYTVKAVDRMDNISNSSESVTVVTNGSGSGGGSIGPITNNGNVTSTNGTITIPAGQSGEVSLGDAVKIVIPAGASDEELKLTIKPVLDTQKLIESNEILLSPVFQVSNSSTKDFSKDVTLTVAFDPTNVTDNQKPSVFFYDESKQVWVEAGGEVNGNTITVSVNRFTIVAVFAVDQMPTINLSDISGHWAEASIRAAVEAGIVNGYADGTFKPNGYVTRAEFTVMLMNALKLQRTKAELNFTDTEEIGAWAGAAVAQAVEAGIVTGYMDGQFRPAAKISRAELAVMIARAYGADTETEASAPTGFSDDEDIPVWSKGAVSVIRQLGIVHGRSGNLFEPDLLATRAEAVTLIMNLLQKMI